MRMGNLSKANRSYALCKPRYQPNVVSPGVKRSPLQLRVIGTKPFLKNADDAERSSKVEVFPILRKNRCGLFRIRNHQPLRDEP